MSFLRRFPLALALVFLAGGSAQAETVLGKGVKVKEATKVSDIYAKPDQFVGKTVRVEGLVTDVCSKRGCWMAIAGDKEFQTLRVKVKDGDIVFPMSARGKRAVVEGEVEKIELTKEQAIEHAKHEAEEKGQPFDPKSVTGPTATYQLKGTGALLP